MFRHRLRVHFNKEGLSRFLGHHDLMRLFERALRRTRLPLAYSAGYNPRPQISFPIALALGVESRDELFEVELLRWTSERSVKEMLEKELPEGIGLVSVESVPHSEKAEVSGTEFAVEISVLHEGLPALIDQYMGKCESLIERVTGSRTKTVNVRKFVEDVRLDGSTMRMNLRVGPDGTARPEEVVAVIMGCGVEELTDLRITRTHLRLSAPPH